MNKSNLREFLLLCLLVGLIVAGRLLPHSPNFTPVAACGLLAACYIRDVKRSITAILLGMFISDAVLGFYQWQIVVAVYAGLLASIGLGRLIRSRITPLRVATCSLTGSVLFFLLSNAAVWWYSGMYKRTWAGLGECYVIALPFLRNTVLGDFVWSATLFGSAAAVGAAWRANRPARLPVHAMPT